jgi:hypothetical protein
MIYSLALLPFVLLWGPSLIDGACFFLRFKHQCVVEVIRRCRGCYVYTLRPRRFKWVATYYAYLTHWFSEDDVLFFKVEDVPKFLAEYKNWLGENRVGA